MKILHAIIAIVFIVIGLALYTGSSEPGRVQLALLAMLVANVSLVAVSLENALDRSPIELPGEDRGPS
jgi:drug/metabolite transporter (DMT)-like permease